MRIVSLLPAATEIIALLGQLDHLVGISHECDFPAEVNSLPRVTHCPLYDAGLSSAEIDRRVREALATDGTLYRMNEPLLRELRPDFILTQQLCDVCAVGYGSVAALAANLPIRPILVNLEPKCLADIFENIRHIGEALGLKERAEAANTDLAKRVAAVRTKAAEVGRRPKVFLMEWIDPPFCSGHWGPELVKLAGGEEIFGRHGERSVQVPWEDVIAAQPEVIVLACCGYKPQRTLQDFPILQQLSGWNDLSAVNQGRVYVVDGNAYFHRPGPRIVDSLEILAEIIHPELFGGMFPDRGVVRLEKSA